MPDVERVLLSKVLQTGELDEVVSRKIETDHFVDPEVREIWDYTLDFQRRYGSTPTVGAVKAEFPDFKPVVDKNPLRYHIDRFIEKVKEREAINVVRDLHDAIEDPDEIGEIELRFFEAARMLTDIVPATRATRFSDPKRKDDYKKRRKTGDTRGILMGIPTLDETLLGLAPGQLATIVGYTGIGKSILMAYMAYSAYLQGKTSLIISLEMSAEEIMERIDVMASKIRYQALRALELDIGEEARWHEIIDKAEADRHQRDIVIQDDMRTCSVEYCFAEASRYKPDVVFVDYLELMSVPRGSNGSTIQGWEKVNVAGMGLKQNARLLRIPHVTAAQLNREGKDKVTLANVSYQSIGKHSDIMLGLQQDDDMDVDQQMEVRSLKIRAGAKPVATLRWKLDTMDIHELGVSERFPDRHRSLSPHERQMETKLTIREVMGGRMNPWTTHAGVKPKNNPWTERVKTT